MDTKALLTFFTAEAGADKVEAILKEIDENRAEGFISPITLTELYYLHLRRSGEEVAKEQIQATPIVAANAKSPAAPVVRADPHFDQVNVSVVKSRED